MKPFLADIVGIIFSPRLNSVIGVRSVPFGLSLETSQDVKLVDFFAEWLRFCLDPRIEEKMEVLSPEIREHQVESTLLGCDLKVHLSDLLQNI